MHRTVVLVLVLVAVTACGSDADTTGATATGATPTRGASAGAVDADVRSGTLGGDPQLEGGCVWLETDEGSRVEVLWPDGYEASVDPIELRDASGTVIARAGDRLSVRGVAATERVSVCQVGEIWSATTVEAAG